MKKKYQVTLIRTEYYEATVEVYAENEHEAMALADGDDVDWGEPTDADVEVSDGNDAVICLDE